MEDNSRRNLFTNIFQKKKSFPISPPYSPENNFLFTEICPDCDGICSTVCEESILKIKNGIPQIDFSESGCTYCEECANSCDKDILSLDNSSNIKGKIDLSVLSCIAWQNVICSSCRDACLDGAIKFLGMLRPEINLDKCTNCGFCISVCPSQAIKIESI